MAPTCKSNCISIRKKKAAAKKVNDKKKKNIQKSGRKPALKIIKKVAPPPMIPIEETCMDGGVDEGVDYSGMPELQRRGQFDDDSDNEDEPDEQTILDRSVWNIDAVITNIMTKDVNVSSSKPKIDVNCTGNSPSYVTNQIKQLKKFFAFWGECKLYTIAIDICCFYYCYLILSLFNFTLS